MVANFVNQYFCITMKKVLITGATGLIGQELVAQCHKENIVVNYLTSSKSKIKNDTNYQGYYWNIDSAEIDANCFTNVDTIINLVGASIAERWTDSYKEEIISSRVDAASLLLNTLKNNEHSVTQIITASAIGFYPNSLTNYYEESFVKVNPNFLGEVVEKWERAIDAFKVLNISVTKIRIGLVLSSKGGVLEKIASPIKYGAGAAFGDGKHWQSWIHINDLVRQFEFVGTQRLEGVFNGVAPNPVTNQLFTKQVADVLNKPLILPNIPRFVMKLALGEMHQLLFESQRVSSAKIEDAGFNFNYPNLEPALQDLLS